MPKEILIVGGGIAGLAATAALPGFRITLLEAQDRWGGRIHSLHTAGQVVELGAEFIHGESLSLMGAIREADLEIQPAAQRNQLHRSGRLEPVEIWETFGELSQRIATREPDQSFLSFIDALEIPADKRQMMLSFVAGFNAADPAKISAHSLRRADYSSEQMNGERQARVRTGYGDLVEHLANRARTSGATLLNNVVVQTVRWQRGRVQVEASTENITETFTADAAIIALPLGVLKAGSVRFEPDLPDKEEAIAGLEFGNVVKITLVFRRHWWPDPDFGFIHSPEDRLQTWWSDPRGPVLTGWAGGPKADALLNHSSESLEDVAIESLSRLFSVPCSTVRSELVSAHTHDWTKDPYFRGAYSYIPVNGLFLPRQLGAPVEETLFFAGEATAHDAQLGTVFAALESGQRAAREVRELLSTSGGVRHPA